MIQLPDQSDEILMSQFQSLDSKNSQWLSRSNCDSGYSVWRCDIPIISGSFGLWIGHLPDFYSFLALQPISHGNMSGFEAFRAWTDPQQRGKGFASELLARAVNYGMVFSDREGMTRPAFGLWRRAANVQYFDGTSNSIVPLASIPSEDLFTPWEQGRRWFILLQ